MKKNTIMVIQPDTTEPGKTAPQSSNAPKKMYRDHSTCDHLYGRTNKFPFGSSHGPAAF